MTEHIRRILESTLRSSELSTRPLTAALELSVAHSIDALEAPVLVSGCPSASEPPVLVPAGR